MVFIKKNIGYLIALSGLGLFLYAFNLHGPLFWDDADWILNNLSLHSLSWDNIKFIFSHDVLAGIGQVSNYYRPFLFLTFLANYLVSGESPVSYHLVSNGLHILNAGLIFYLVVRWLGTKRVAFLASLLFLIHPLQTEAVAYISGRGDPLSAFFMLIGLVIYPYTQQSTGWRKVAFWLLSVGVMILAVLSRETAVLFPVYLGVVLMAFSRFDYRIEDPRSLGSGEYKGTFLSRFKKAFVSVLPFVGISVIYGLLRLTVLNFQNTLNFYQQGNIYSENLVYRVYTFFHALVVYLRLIVWPVGLHMDRDIPVSLSILDYWSWLGGLIIIGLIGWLFWLYLKSLSSEFGVWFFGVSIFFVNLIPTSGLIPINARIYEHWLYFSLFGIAIITGFYLDRFLTYLKLKNNSIYVIFYLLFIIYISFLSVQTIKRNILWGNVEKLYLNILYYEPNDVRVLNNLGNWYSGENNNIKAAPLYRQAIEADPNQPAPYYNLGNIARDSRQIVEAEALYKKAIEVSPMFYYAYGNLAQLYVEQSKLAEAIIQLQNLQKIYPTAQNQKNIELLEKDLNN